MSRRSVIQSVAHAVPTKVLTNKDLETMVETSDEWIVQRTGIKERRICQDDENTATLAVSAGQQALDKAGMTAEDIDLIICGTVSGCYMWPSTACYVQDALGAKHAGAFDISAACAGFVYGVSVADAMIRSGQSERILLIGVDTLSRQVDWTDRGTCILFGDAAGACVIAAQENTDRGIVESVLLSDGSGARHIAVEVGGSLYPYGSPQSEGHSTCITMNGAEVYRFAVNAMGEACCRVVEKAGLTPDDIDLFVPHQANLRIIDSAAKRLGLPPERVFVNVERYGNTSGGSVPLALSEAELEGRLKPGMIVVTVGFGAGLVWGANVIRW
jgi:3-oxoacyl-[acyl-carrier-protein] synthase-3